MGGLVFRGQDKSQNLLEKNHQRFSAFLQYLYSHLSGSGASGRERIRSISHRASKLAGMAV